MNTEFYGQLALCKKIFLFQISIVFLISYSLQILTNLKHRNFELKSILRSDNSFQILNIKSCANTKLNIYWKL